jgi:hypothetical protein
VHIKRRAALLFQRLRLSRIVMPGNLITIVQSDVVPD